MTERLIEINEGMMLSHMTINDVNVFVIIRKHGKRYGASRKNPEKFEGTYHQHSITRPKLTYL